MHEAYRTTNGQFTPGHPRFGGRQKAEPDAEPVLTPQAIFKRRGFVPHELMVDACEVMLEKLREPGFTKSEFIKLLGIYMDTLLRSAEFVTPKLKAVEHSGSIDVLQRLRDVQSCSDEDLPRLIADAQEYISKHSEG